MVKPRFIRVFLTWFGPFAWLLCVADNDYNVLVLLLYQTRLEASAYQEVSKLSERGSEYSMNMLMGGGGGWGLHCTLYITTHSLKMSLHKSLTP